MNRLSYNNDKELALANPRDLLNFFSMLHSESQFKGKQIFVGNYSYVHDEKNHMMATATIRFQVFDKKDSKVSGSRGKIFEWRSYRAKSFACSNSGFYLVEDTTENK